MTYDVIRIVSVAEVLRSMRIGVVAFSNTIESIAKLDPSVRHVHYSDRLTVRAAIQLLERCKNLEVVELAPSDFCYTPAKSLDLLRLHGVECICGRMPAARHRKNLDGTVVVDDRIIEKIKRMYRSGESIDAIFQEVEYRDHAGISKAMIRYIATKL